MTFDHEVELIKISHSDDPEVIITETSRTLLANKKSVVRSEFYQAFANNLKPTIIFEIHAFEYENEQKLRHEGQDYLIIRTYSKNSEILELICQAYDDIQANLARLRDTVEIWHNTIIENSMGEQSPSPALLYKVPAQIEFKGGGSGTTGASDTIVTETINNATVTIKYREGIMSAMFLKINGERWDIKFIEDPYNRHETLILHVERVLP